MRSIVYSQSAFEEFIEWNLSDKKVFRKISALIKEILRTPFEGSGKPELLKHDYKGLWSRRIDKEH